MSISGNKVKFFLLLIIEEEVFASPIITMNLSFCFYIAIYIYIYLFHVFDTVFRRIDAQIGASSGSNWTSGCKRYLQG